MNNLLPLIDDDGEIASESQKQKNGISKLDQAVSSGKSIMKNRLGNAVANAIPNIDAFVDKVDNIAQVRQDKTLKIRRSILSRPIHF